jgi:hemin uptake protein HemP
MSDAKQPKRPTLALTPFSELTRFDSKILFNGQRELIIAHQGEEYRLRITRQEKLILTK